MSLLCGALTWLNEHSQSELQQSLKEIDLSGEAALKPSIVRLDFTFRRGALICQGQEKVHVA